MAGIRTLLEELAENEQRDYEGDLCCRVHIKTAEEIIRKAYNKGILDSRKMAENKEDLEERTRYLILNT